MLLKWDAVTGATGYMVRWRIGAADYQPNDKYIVQGTQYDPNTVTTFPPGQIVNHKVCALVGSIEGAYTPEICLIPAPANLRWE